MVAQVLDDVADDAPDDEVAVLADEHLGVVLVGWGEAHAVGPQRDTFDGEVAVDEAHGDGAVGGLERAVDDEQVAALDAGVHHRVADDARAECRRRVADEFAVEVDRVAVTALRGTGKAGLDAALKELE